MPVFPDRSARLEHLGTSVFSSLAGRLSRYEGEIYPLHIGDTWLDPAPGSRMQDLRVDEHAALHCYAPTRGLPALIDRIAARAAARSDVPTDPANVLIVSGATAGLSAAMATLLDPGDEVMILAPYWPLIAGIVRYAGGVPVAVPWLGEDLTTEEALRRLETHRTSKTVAVYLNTPNNPSGDVVAPDRIDTLARWATEHELWLVSDEVYEDYVFEGTHRYVRSAAPERTLAVHSFSKAYGMAGNRCGYLLGPPEVVSEVEKITTHAVYCAPRAAQVAGLNVLGDAGDAWLADTRERYASAGRKAATRLGIAAPGGGTFLFMDVADWLDDRGLVGFLERCVDHGLLLAPGPSFGPYPTHIRLCFTCAKPDVVERGVEVLAGLIDR